MGSRWGPVVLVDRWCYDLAVETLIKWLLSPQVDLGVYKGRACVVVNVASKWGSFSSFLRICTKKVFVEVACKWDHFYHFQILGQCQVSSYSQSWSLVTTLISGGLGHENKEIVGNINMVMMVNHILHLIGEERQSQTMLSWRPCTSRCLSLKPFPVCMSVTFGSNKLQLSTTWD